MGSTVDTSRLLITVLDNCTRSLLFFSDLEANPLTGGWRIRPRAGRRRIAASMTESADNQTPPTRRASGGRSRRLADGAAHSLVHAQIQHQDVGVSRPMSRTTVRDTTFPAQCGRPQHLDQQSGAQLDSTHQSQISRSARRISG